MAEHPIFDIGFRGPRLGVFPRSDGIGEQPRRGVDLNRIFLESGDELRGIKWGDICVSDEDVSRRREVFKDIGRNTIVQVIAHKDCLFPKNWNLRDGSHCRDC